MTFNDSPLAAAIAACHDPWLDTTLGAAKAVREAALVDGLARVVVELGFPAAGYASELAARLEAVARAVPGVSRVQVEVRWQVLVELRIGLSCERVVYVPGPGPAVTASPAE